MKNIRNRHAKIATEESIHPFESITQKFLTSMSRIQIQCPTCGTLIDFNKGVTWEGPDTFLCCGCDRFLSMRLIHRALRDLGIE